MSKTTVPTPTVYDIVQRVQRLNRLYPQQIVSDNDAPAEQEAAIIDQFGRAHWLWPVTTLGRELDDCDIAVLESSVSRRHAEFRKSDGDKAWRLVDLGSTNGTFVEGKRISESTPLSEGDRVMIGEVGFAFITRQSGLFELKVTASQAWVGTSEPSGPTVVLLGSAPSGGGIVEHTGAYVELGPTQYTFLEYLAKRWLEDADKDGQLRGFVQAIELFSELPWETPYPEANNVKQLVRRVRRSFDRAGRQTPVEGRKGFGYRLNIPARIAG